MVFGSYTMAVKSFTSYISCFLNVKIICQKSKIQFKILTFTTQHNVLSFDLKTDENGKKPQRFGTIWFKWMLNSKNKQDITCYKQQTHVKQSCNITMSCNTNFCDDTFDDHNVLHIDVFLSWFCSVQTSCIVELRLKI